jgi:hypothetical protein
LPYVRVRFSDEVWDEVKKLANKELRRPACQVVILVERGLRELQQEEARRQCLGRGAAGPAQEGGDDNGDRTQ